MPPSWLDKSCLKQGCRASLAIPVLLRAMAGRPLVLPLTEIPIDDRILIAYAVSVVIAGGLELWCGLGFGRTGRRHHAQGVPRADQIPDHACYYCIRRPGICKCGGCRLVFYCGRACQLQAWRRHRHICGAASNAIGRIQRSQQSLTPSQWRCLQEYAEFVRGLLSVHGVIPHPSIAADILCKMGVYIGEHPHLVCQEIADSIWAAAISMRSNGTRDRLHMAWAWVFLEAVMEAGSPEAFLTTLELGDGANGNLARVSRWMRRGLCQSLLMLTRRSEVGAFLRSVPRVAAG